MSFGTLLLAALVTSNIFAVVFLGPPTWVAQIRSLRRALAVSLALGAAGAVTAGIFHIVHLHVLVRFGLDRWAPLILTVIVVLCGACAELIGRQLFPYSHAAIRRFVPVLIANVAVYTIAYALGTSSQPGWMVPILAFAGGSGAALCLVPLAAIRRRMDRFLMHREIGRDALMWLAAGAISLAFLFISTKLPTRIPTLW